MWQPRQPWQPRVAQRKAQPDRSNWGEQFPLASRSVSCLRHFLDSNWSFVSIVNVNTNAYNKYRLWYLVFIFQQTQYINFIWKIYCEKLCPWKCSTGRIFPLVEEKLSALFGNYSGCGNVLSYNFQLILIPIRFRWFYKRNSISFRDTSFQNQHRKQMVDVLFYSYYFIQIANWL